MFDIKPHLKALVEAHAPSGYEGPIREILRDEWEGLVDAFDQDRLGSLIGIKRATRPLKTPRKIMLAAHMDEIGLMVRDVVDGFIYVHNLAGIDRRIMLSQPMLVHGKERLHGVVAAVPPHFLKASDRKKYPSFDALVIDVGLLADEVNDLVQIGDLITPHVSLLELQGKRVAGKAMDDRACVATVTACLHELQNMHHSWDVYATATVQEEVGVKGAHTAAYHIDPDIAIALDVGFASQPGVDSTQAIDISKGPGIGMGVNFHPKLYDKLHEVAKYHEIKLQVDVIPSNSGTDATAIQVAREGIPTALLEIPIRNMHSTVETLDLQDIQRGGRLLAHFIAQLDDEFMSSLAWDVDESVSDDESEGKSNE